MKLRFSQRIATWSGLGLVVLCCFHLGMVAEAATPPALEHWLKAIDEQRQRVAELETGQQELAAKKAVYKLGKQFPILTDWILQDASPDAFALLMPSSGERVEGELLQKLGVSQAPSSSVERLGLYAERCLQRREQRLRPSLDQWAPFAFSETHSAIMTFIGYTEGLSDARAERFFKPGSRLSVLHFDDKSTFGRIEHLVDDPHGMIRDVDVSYDLNRLLFAWKKSDRLDDYHIYEYDLKEGGHQQLTRGLGRADYEPVYLPDGDIVFASTRPEQSVPCWWTEISNLYRMDAQGRYIRRLAVDQVHTLYPQVLNNGRISYTRWDYSDRGQNYPHPVFSMDPDGQAQRVFYGGNSWFPTSLLHTRAIPDSHKVMSIAAGHHTRQHGKLVILDVNEGRDEGVGMHFVAPKRKVAYERVDAAQQHGDQFRYPFPLSESELLISYLPDWGYEPALEAHQKDSKRRWARHRDMNDYSLYWMNTDGEREYLYGDDQLGIQRVASLGHRPEQPVIADTVDYNQTKGTLYVHDVYKGVGLQGIPRGAAKQVRVVRLNYRAAGIGLTQNGGEGGGSLNSTPVSIGNGTWDIKEILGDADIHADGSALFEVPANESIYLQVLDKRGRVIQTTRTWDTVRPGEQKACVGCHDKANANFYPFKKEDTLAWKHGVQQLKPFYGATRGFSFQHEIQPILDRSCVSCHDGTQEGAMDLRGMAVTDATDNRRQWTRSYLNLTGAQRTRNGDYRGVDPEGGLVSWISKMSRPTELPPYFAGAAKSPLLKMLEGGHHKAQLTEEEYHKFSAWMDLLVPFCGTYREAHQWADHEMRKYDYFEEKRRQQHKEEVQYIADFLGRLTGSAEAHDEAAPFTRAAYAPVWTSAAFSLTGQQAFSIETNTPFLLDRMTIRAEGGQPVNLQLRKGSKTIHRFQLNGDADSASWHSGGKVFRSRELTLWADRDITLASIEAHGVPEADLPEWNGYKPHLNY